MLMSNRELGSLITTTTDRVRGDLFLSYRSHLIRKGLAKRSIETYGDCLEKLSHWNCRTGPGDLLAITADDLERFSVWLSKQDSARGGKLSAASRAKHIAVIRKFYQYLQREGLILGNPAGSLRYPKVSRKMNRDVLTVEELRQLLDVDPAGDAEIRDALVIRLLALSGLRVQELRDLDTGDVNPAQREIVVRSGKGDKDRLTFHDSYTRSLLAKYLAGPWHRLQKKATEALIIGGSGWRISCNNARAIVTRRAKAAGIRKNVTPHGLRHTFCTQLLIHGCGLKQIAELAGHASLGTTAKYTRLDIRELSRVYHSAHPRSIA